MGVDNILKLYAETIRSSYLHYGFWDDPGLIDIEALTLEDIKKAQNRYIENLSSYIPKAVKSILDVGCGIGGNAAYLLDKGYDIETLSPDDYQRKIINQKFGDQIPFHHCKFEQFYSKKKFDLILESESACYIKIDEGFSKARVVLRDGGYLLASDYFVHFKDSSKSPHLKSSHDINKYLESSKSHGFNLIREFDQTDNTMITLDYGKYFMDRFIEPSIDYLKYSIKKNYPKTSSLFLKLFESKIKSKKEQLDLLDSVLFRKYRKYMIFLFQKV
ncbi:MAG: hypothetical protein CMG60_00470 [Candidatus Marinimicrobia bacterium]|nr:hypothetical protein [Candidatus Neomarinimicrobiota bacterium]|tara:strand:- start:137 stop:958 length:822 start_codon:yes stop_codon:yes gene_type:complete